MDRRDFLKGSIGLSVAGMTALVIQPGWERGALAAGAGAQTRVLGRLLRGTRDGFVYESFDAGQSWSQIAKFGRHCAITAIRDWNGQAQIEMAVQGYRFTVSSTDARLWRTVS